MSSPLDESDIHWGRALYTGVERRGRSRTDNVDGLLMVLLKRAWWLISRSDTAPTKFTLALAATLWSIVLTLPGEQLSRPIFSYLADTVGTHADGKWAAIWASVAVLMMWRTFSGVHRPAIGLLVNVWTAMVFASVPIGLILESQPPASIGAHLALACAAAWVTVRTDIYVRPGRWPND